MLFNLSLVYICTGCVNNSVRNVAGMKNVGTDGDKG